MTLPGRGIEWRPYQEDGIKAIMDMLKKERGAILGDDMGLGKTPQGAAVCSMLGQVTLIVCPAAVRHQWATWAMRMGHAVAVLGPPSEKAFVSEWLAWKTRQVQWAIVSYNKMGDALKMRIPGTIAFDEPHNYLQGRGNTYVKQLWKYGGAITYKLMLTGTPYLSKPAGLWQMFNILHGRKWGKARDFDVRYCNGHEGTWGWDNRGATNVPELRARMATFMVRRMKAEVAKDLPKVTRTVRWVEGTKQATAALARAQTTIVGMRGAVTATLPEKDKEVVALLEEASSPTVVFTWQRVDADRLGAVLGKEGIEHMVIHGENTAAERARMVAAAAQLKCHVITTYGSSGQGLDGLQHFCSNAVYHAIDPVPAIVLQASGRLDRIGQTLPVTETYLAMRDSVDELTVDKVVNRLDTWASIMGADKSTVEVRNALAMSGIDVDNDAVMAAIFADMTGE